MSINGGSHTRINTLGRLTRSESGQDISGRYDMNNYHKMVGGGPGIQPMYTTTVYSSETTGDSYG
ncbi:hypothetical protein XELAEV_180316182mg, partial [Xenopus laevis]